ncbi:uncharacterized protein LOC134271255 isoform X2 [Saccostrea cucullata]|uniref:uncharacterized protein LOC134271255 isoform X2 n=1 Tax=Saccostrea cuccullata TaxID=36930 RepID=UPI002ED5B0FE
MCKRNLETASNSTDCCYNHYFNGSACIACPHGYFGHNCDKKCTTGYFGYICSNKCNCSAEFCNHETGCPPEDLGEVTNVHHTTTTESEITSRFQDEFLNQTTKLDIRFTSVTVGQKTQRTKSLSVTSRSTESTSRSENPKPAMTEFPLNSSFTIIIGIGGLIALFLAVIMIQFCIKLYQGRQKKLRRISRNISPVKEEVKEEETYQEINEAILIKNDRLNSDGKDNKQFEKYYELKNTKFVKELPYQRIRSKDAKCQEMAKKSEKENIDLLSTSIGSEEDSQTSYINPKTQTVHRHSYIDVLDSGITTEDMDAASIKEDNSIEGDSCSQYIDPIHHVIPENDKDAYSGGYLDVTSNLCSESSYIHPISM